MLIGFTRQSRIVARELVCARFVAASITKRTSSTMADKVLNDQTLNPHVKQMEYAVRGPIVIRAGEIEKEMKQVIITTTKQSRKVMSPTESWIL